MTWHIISTKKLNHEYLGAAKKYNLNITNVPMIRKKVINEGTTLDSISKFCKNHQVDPHPIVFTSGFGVQSFTELLNLVEASYLSLPWQVFCTMPKTKKLAQQCLPNTQIMDTANNAQKLASKIVKSGIKKVTFFCGTKRRKELVDTLTKAQIKITEHHVYTTELTPKPVVAPYDGVMFFSPSAVESFLSKNPYRSEKNYFSIGSTTAHHFFKLTASRSIIAATPSTESLIEKTGHFYQNIQ